MITPAYFEEDHLLCLMGTVIPFLEVDRAEDVVIVWLQNSFRLPKGIKCDTFTIFVKFEGLPDPLTFVVSKHRGMVLTMGGDVVQECWENERHFLNYVHSCQE